MAERQRVHEWMMEHSPSYANSSPVVQAYLRDGLLMDVNGGVKMSGD